MAETNPQFNDGALPYGSRVEVFNRVNGPGSTGVLGNYILENISISRPTTLIQRFDQIGGPTGSVGVPKHVTGSATSQLAATTTTFLRNGDWFSDTFDSSLGLEYFYIYDVEHPELSASRQPGKQREPTTRQAARIRG
jgi:hypothetical protein